MARGQNRSLVITALAALAALTACSAAGEGGTGGGSAGTGSGDEPAVNYAASDTCSVFPQEGCPPTHTCVVASVAGATICRSAGAAPRGGACGSSSDCARGLVCVDSTCRPFCEQASDCQGDATACIQITLGGEPVAGWTVCSLPCNPADPANTAGLKGLVACPSWMGCFPLDADVGPHGSTDCFAVGQAGFGAPCEGAGQCGPGLVCLSDGSSATCQKLCLLGSSGCSCLSFADPFHAAINGEIEEVGYCG